MLIRRADLDPDVVEAVMAGIQASYLKPDPSKAERQIQQEEARRFTTGLGPMLACVFGGMGVWAAATFALQAAGVPAWIAIPVGAALYLALILTGVFGSTRAQRDRANVLHADLLAGWLPHLELTRTQRAYCETLSLLARPELQVDERIAREILAELNRLMEHSRRLEAQRAEAGALLASQSADRIEEERRSLAARLEQTADPQARASLQESLRLCDERLANARSLEPVIERLDAQQEMIFQTLASIQSTLARMEAAQQALTAPDVQEIRGRLDEMGSRAQAVEQAVQEVVTLQRA